MAYMNNPYMNMYPQSFGYPQYNNYQQNQSSINQINNQQISNYINGQMVADYNEVISKNTPLDGSSNYYPLVDGSAIYCKKLNVNTGASQLLTYRLVEEQHENNNDYITNVLAQFKSDITSELNELKNLVLDNITSPDKKVVNINE